jgi:protein-S-isoprenylcysteine O-methyltransferase Ste14
MPKSADTYEQEAVRQPLNRALVFDIAERLFVSLLMVFFLYRFIPVFHDRPFGILLVFSEIMVFIFVLFRRFGPAVNTGRAWAAAIVGTCAPLLVLPGGGIQLIPSPVAYVLMLTGILFSVSAKMFLRRSFGIVAANRGIQLAGPYRLVRHPMYFGYLLSHLAFILLNLNAWNVAVYAACWSAMFVRIRLEEGILSEDAEYRTYTTKVTSRLIPAVW